MNAEEIIQKIEELKARKVRTAGHNKRMRIDEQIWRLEVQLDAESYKNYLNQQ